MKIVIIGPGQDPNRFGTYFSNKAEADGHSVIKFSYRLGSDKPHVIADKYANTISNIDKIDLLLYNCIGGFYPGNPKHYTSDHEVGYEGWKEGILINAAMPHMFAVKSLAKMDNTSNIVFMTSSASYLINRDNYLNMAGYFGTKGAMNHLMRALAEYNDKGATVCTFGPHIPYDDPPTAKQVMNTLYKRMTNLTKEDNGKIIQCYPPGGHTFYHEGGKHA